MKGRSFPSHRQLRASVQIKTTSVIVFTVFAVVCDHVARQQEFGVFCTPVGRLWPAWLLRLSLLMWAQELMAGYNMKKRRFPCNSGSKLSPLARYIALGQPSGVRFFLGRKSILQQVSNLLFFKFVPTPIKRMESSINR